MPDLAMPGQPSNPPIWTLIAAMIAASPDRPWVWVALLAAGAVITGIGQRRA
ncbi:hypothetical protein ACFPC0_15495 [Streptomyces andamanensis]|uniref:Uncharacterized protein n=1 Tax=Streptomyces andamanensis TaxID=1565035 RepID=A0ABV8TET0_9ACTN